MIPLLERYFVVNHTNYYASEARHEYRSFGGVYVFRGGVYVFQGGVYVFLEEASTYFWGRAFTYYKYYSLLFARFTIEFVHPLHPTWEHHIQSFKKTCAQEVNSHQVFTFQRSCVYKEFSVLNIFCTLLLCRAYL